MNHEQREHSRSAYFAAACYASAVLGADASKRFDELRRLSHSDDLDSLKSQIDRWAGDSLRSPKLAGHDGGEPRPARPSFQPWMPCAHHQSADPDRPFRLCPTCVRERASAKFAAEQKARRELVAGWYKQYGKWIVARVNAELPKYTELKGEAYTELEREMVALCWAAINQQAGSYEDKGLKHGAMAWLKTVVFGTVANHFRDQFRKCRDVRKEAVLPPDDTLLAPWEPMEARPTRPAGGGADEFEEDTAEAYRCAISR